MEKELEVQRIAKANNKEQMFQVSISRDKLNNPNVLKKASALMMQAVELLSSEDHNGTGAISGIEVVEEEIRRLSSFLKATHLDYIATRTYDIDAIMAQLAEANELLAQMRDSRISRSSDFYEEIIANEMRTAMELVPEAAMESDDAVDDILSESSKVIREMSDLAVERQFANWNVDHSSEDPYMYQEYAAKLKLIWQQLTETPGRNS